MVVNLATGDPDETVTFRASRYDRSPGARIYTLNLFDELTRHASAATDLRRLCDLVAAGRLDGGVELEFPWREYATAFDALLRRRAGGKIVLHVD
jgi:NADPH:quinone reductase-like Zn-dependent oxidoreductase